MTSNGTLQDGCDERHDVRFRKRWRCLLRVKLRNTQHEQMSSALHPTTDVGLARAKGVTRIDGVGAYNPFVADPNVMERRRPLCAQQLKIANEMLWNFPGM